MVSRLMMMATKPMGTTKHSSPSIITMTLDKFVMTIFLVRYLIGPILCHVTMTCVMDSCHAGTVLDVPYIRLWPMEHKKK